MLFNASHRVRLRLREEEGGGLARLEAAAARLMDDLDAQDATWRNTELVLARLRNRTPARWAGREGTELGVGCDLGCLFNAIAYCEVLDSLDLTLQQLGSVPPTSVSGVFRSGRFVGFHARFAHTTPGRSGSIQKGRLSIHHFPA